MLPTIQLYDSYLKKTIELTQESIVNPESLKVYSCGPTVYNYQHIGNIRAAFLPDIFVRTARIAGYDVDWVLNVTDVGHLVGDGDGGANVTNAEDKIEKSAKSSGKTVDEIVEFYLEDYKAQAKAIGVQLPIRRMNPKATEFISEQMVLALELLRDRKAYLLEDGIYYDYGVNLFLDTPFELRVSEGDNSYTGRDIVNTTKSPMDFALWKFVPEINLQKWRFADFENAVEVFAQCDDPEIGLHGNVMNYWGTPGWHSECVAMICGILGKKLLKNRTKFSFADFSGKTVIDLHFGGEDHIDIHHKNEILQSEALGFHLSKFWVHNKFVIVDGKKMSKSLGNVFLVVGDRDSTGFDSLESMGYDPLSYRMLMLEHHYTNQMDFTWDKLTTAQTRLYNLRKEVAKIMSFARENYVMADELFPHNIDWRDDDKIDENDENTTDSFDRSEMNKAPQIKVLLELLTNNLDTPKFLEKFTAFVLEVSNEIKVNSNLNAKNLQTLLFWEREFLNLGLAPEITDEVMVLGSDRFAAKLGGDYAKSDELRNQILELGFQIDDYSWGWGVWKKV
jgi:cysteinyl-tRNA synthetase